MTRLVFESRRGIQAFVRMRRNSPLPRKLESRGGELLGFCAGQAQRVDPSPLHERSQALFVVDNWSQTGVQLRHHPNPKEKPCLKILS